MKNLSHLQFFKLVIILVMMAILVSSLPNEEAMKLENSEGCCSKGLCQELRERVESLEKTVRTIVASLSSKDDTNPSTNVPGKSFGNHQDNIAMHINESSGRTYIY